MEWVRGDSVGEGGQGFAYHATRATDSIGGWVLKVLRDSVPTERFEREIHALDRLDSPRIPNVVDYGLVPGERFYVSPYKGKSLPTWLAGVQLTARKKLDLLADVLQAVVDAHSVGVAHRDIKPNNIVVDEAGRAFLIDFGLCAIVDDQLVSMTSQDKYGNEAFAAPECLHGSPLECGTEADIYSFGKLVFWMASEGRYIYRESLDDVLPDTIRDADHWSRLQIGSLVRATVVESMHGRPTAPELMEHLSEVCEAIDNRQTKRATGEITLWDNLGPRNVHSRSGSRSITAPPYGNPPAFSELALRFENAHESALQLSEISIPLTVRAGSGDFISSLHTERDGQPGEVIQQWPLRARDGILTFQVTERPLLQPGAAYWLALSVEDGEIAWWAAENRTLRGLPATFSERFGREGSWPVHQTRLGHACRLVGIDPA